MRDMHLGMFKNIFPLVEIKQSLQPYLKLIVRDYELSQHNRSMEVLK